MQPRLCQTPNGTQETTFFLPAFLEDNALGRQRDPGYEARLMARDPMVAQALRYGRWSVFSGQALREWDRRAHVLSYGECFDIPAHWLRWRSVDWGFAAPWCVLWWARDPDTRRMYVYREVYKVGLTDPQQARMIVELSGVEQFAYTFADPSMWTRRTTSEVVTSTADVYAQNGVLLTPGDNNQANKLRKTHAVLRPLPDGLPEVQIFEGCTNLIRTLPALVTKPGQPEVLEDDQEDHGYDAFAYGLTNWRDPAPALPARKPKPARRSPLLDPAVRRIL